jgi:hypothetical protein
LARTKGIGARAIGLLSSPLALKKKCCTQGPTSHVALGANANTIKGPIFHGARVATGNRRRTWLVCKLVVPGGDGRALDGVHHVNAGLAELSTLDVLAVCVELKRPCCLVHEYQVDRNLRVVPIKGKQNRRGGKPTFGCGHSLDSVRFATRTEGPRGGRTCGGPNNIGLATMLHLHWTAHWTYSNSTGGS